VYGPVRTVVWEGRSCEAPPYPDQWPKCEVRDVRSLVAIGGEADVAHHLRAVLLRQKSICDNQCHHARENQQSREGFSDHWPRRMARSRWTGLRFRRSLGPHDFALCRWRASLWFRRRAHASHLIVISAVDLANGQGRRLGLAHRLESGSIVSQKALCV